MKGIPEPPNVRRVDDTDSHAFLFIPTLSANEEKTAATGKFVDKDNLIEYLSGGNHELFHSNLLAFMAKHYKEIFLELFYEVKDVLADYDSEDVEREKKNFDLSIKNKKAASSKTAESEKDKNEEDYLLILENKMKSFPNMEQLQEYKEKGKSKSYILLSLLDADKKELSEAGWKLIKYSDLASRLDTILGNDEVQIDNFFRTLLKHYVKYLQNLSKKVEQITDDFNNSLDTVNIQDYLATNENDNDDLPDWQKLFVRKIRFQLVSERIKQKTKGETLICNAGVVRGWIPLIELVPHTKEELDKKDYNYWVQIYDDHIERGFTIHYDSVPGGDGLKKSRPKGRAKKERQKFFENVWKECMKINLFENISQTLAQKYKLSEFGEKANENENASEYRGYIYDTFTMIDLHSDLPDIAIGEFIDSIVEESKEIRYLIEQAAQDIEDKSK